MAEDGDEVIGRDDFIWDELVEALQPRKGEMLLYAAKRCQAMAAKLPAAQKSVRKYQNSARYWREEAWFYREEDRHWQELFKTSGSTLRQVKREMRAAWADVKNWKRKAEKIAAALGVREGETLVEAAERVAQERGEWKKVKEYWERQVKQQESYASADAMQECVDAYARFTGMSTAKVEPHPEPPPQKWD